MVGSLFIVVVIDFWVFVFCLCFNVVHGVLFSCLEGFCVLCHFPAVPCVGLWYVSVTFPDHTH